MSALFKKKPKKPCRDKKDCVKILGPVLVALGAGVFLANIIPPYMLIIIFGTALIGAGIWVIIK